MFSRAHLAPRQDAGPAAGSIQQAVRQDTGEHVLIASASALPTDLVQRSRLRNQAALLAPLAGTDGLLIPSELIDDDEGLVLVFPDPGGQPLSSAKPRPAVDVFLRLAHGLARALDVVHRAGVVHGGIDPTEILVDPEGRPWLVGFGDGARMGRESLPPVRLDDPDVRLPYISPEQTGRMNRSIDERTDLYSLGVVLYEYLTGSLPFVAPDAMAWVHAHIAQKPEPARAFRDDLPLVVSALLDRLLAKTADDRYQSASGLASDLETCLARWGASRVIESFPLGRQDGSSRFDVPDRLYGRDDQLSLLTESFERALDGARALTLVTGHSGIGKSRLIQELHRPVVTHHAWFVAGKSDQYRRSQPYLALIRALTVLMRQVLSESDERVDAWRELIVDAVGPNGQLLVDVIPELEILLGPQPAVPELPSSETVQRFNRTFLRFIQAAATGGRTLVIFLDDLQWADGPSLALIEALLSSSQTRNLLIIGAYRDSEVDQDHPLMRTVAALEQASVSPRLVELGPLSPADVHDLVTDALGGDRQASAELAAAVSDKTGGNPFFIRQFLRRLHDDGIIRRSKAAGTWTWDSAALARTAYTDNVVELMASSIQELSQQAQEALAAAAFVGVRFELLALAEVLDQDVDLVAGHVRAAVDVGLVLPEGDALRVIQAGRPERPAWFRFVHDRVQEAAHHLVPADQRPLLHLCIGRRTLARAQSGQSDELLFGVVTHIMAGLDLVTDPEERLDVARLMLRAGLRAMDSVAHDLAYDCFRTGLELLGSDAWTQRYDMALDLTVGAAEACYLTRRAELARQYTEVVLACATDVLDKVRVYELGSYFAYIEHRFADALELGMEVLELLGYPLQDPPDPSRFPAMLGAIAAAQGDLAVAELIDLPEVTDPKADAAMRIMTGLVPTVHGARPDLFAPMIFTGVHTFMTKGMTPAAAGLCTGYGLLLGLQGAYEAGAEFGRLSMQMLDRYPSSHLCNPVLVQYSFFVMHWTEPVREILSVHRRGQARCRELGDIVNAGFCGLGWVAESLLSGTDLSYLSAEADPLLATLAEDNQFVSLNCTLPFAQAVACLRGQAEDPGRLSGAIGDFDALHAAFEPLDFALGLFYLRASALYISCLFQRWDEALVHARAVQVYQVAATGSVTQPWAHAFCALAILRAAEAAEGDLQDALIAELDLLLFSPDAPASSLRTWGEACGVNHRQRLLMIEAERARMVGDVLAATALYDQALDAARDNGYVNDAAFIAELAASFHLGLGRQRIARAYVVDALDGYHEWGATAKVVDLEARFSGLVPQRTKAPATQAISPTGGAALDLATVTKASTAIASELVLDRLLERLMRIVLENAGARRALLVLPRDTGLRIAAVASVEREQVDVLDQPLRGPVSLATAVVNYVARTLEDVVIADARRSQRFAGDRWLHDSGVRSVLCTALVSQGRLSAIIYLENDLAAGAFDPDRVELLRVLAGQAAIALDHARLYDQLRIRSEELERKNTELTELDRLRDQFLANTSHELRTPLNGIIGIAESLLEGATGTLSQPTQDNLGLVVSSARRLSNLVNDLLDFSTLQHRRIELARKPVDLHSMAAAVLSLSQWLVGEKALRLDNQVPEDLPAVDADEARLEQILTNLVGNAVKFTEVGGVTVQARAVPADSAGPPLLRVEVVDTGVGIRKEVQDRIFESFEQADGSTSRLFGGTGLGLAVARELVQLHGGEIGVESQPGRGSTFWFTIPASDRPAESSLPTLTPRRIEPVPGRHPVVPLTTAGEDAPRILVVDDDATNLQVLVNQLSVRGFDVASAVSGIHALNMIDGGYRPDLVLLDVMMPTITGYDVTRTLRERFLPSELPIVLLTAKTLVRDLIEGLEAGANDYLTKPFSSGELLARLRTHLNLAQVNRAVARFVPADFLRLLERESIVDVRLGDSVEKTMSVLFSDIRSFTAMSESKSPRENFRFINEYLGYMEPVVVDHHGFIDKYIGDAVMALFDRGADDAVKAGIGMLTAVGSYNLSRHRRGERGIRIGVGVNSGRLMLGTVGGKGRMDGTVISDAVNLGARLEGLTKRYGVNMLVTEYTHALLVNPEQYRMRRLDRIAVRGKQVPVTIYEVFDADPADELVAKLETREDFELGVTLYHSGDWIGAHQSFLRVLHRNPTDLAAEHYVDRCRRRGRTSIDGSID